MRDKNHGHARPARQALKLGQHRLPQMRVQIGRGRVQQQDAGARGEAARERHPLPLCTTETVGASVGLRRQADHGERLRHPLRARKAERPGPESHVARDAHMRPDRIALEHHAELPILGRTKRVASATTWPSISIRPASGRSSPAKAQERGLAATLGAKQGEEAARGHGHRYCVDGARCAESERESVAVDGGHPGADWQGSVTVR